MLCNKYQPRQRKCIFALHKKEKSKLNRFPKRYSQFKLVIWASVYFVIKTRKKKNRGIKKVEQLKARPRAPYYPLPYTIDEHQKERRRRKSQSCLQGSAIP